MKRFSIVAKGHEGDCRSRSQKFTRSFNVCLLRPTGVFDITSSQRKMSE
jgi:hypothetical protein